MEVRIEGVPLPKTTSINYLVDDDDLDEDPWKFKVDRVLSFDLEVKFISWPIMELMMGLPRPIFSGPWRLSGDSWYRSGIFPEEANLPDTARPFERRVNLND